MKITNGFASWNNPDAQSNFEITNINLEASDKGVCGIVGPVGSGKSTLLNIITGELELSKGSININGSLSYAAQEPWLFEGSIRQNILFVEEFDEKRYYEVIKVCALERDLSLFPYGDLTIVGERGVCLSGGQKARINLARAVYKRADIYLLDDPLSAVDTHVGKHIFEQCLREYLGDKIVFLVTHQLKVLKDVEHVVVMNAGRIDAQGSYKEIEKNKYLKSIFLEVEETEEDKRKSVATTDAVEFQKDNDTPEEDEEIGSVGAVGLETYKSYFKSVKSALYVSFIAILFVISQIVSSSTDFFLSKWVNWEESVANLGITESRALNATDLEVSLAVGEEFNGTYFEPTLMSQIKAQRQEYVILYSVLICAIIWLVIHKSFAFFSMTLRASVNLHDNIFRGIIRGPMSFYNSNPSGRILNRFSKDIGAIDTQLPTHMIDVLMVSLKFTLQ